MSCIYLALHAKGRSLYCLGAAARDPRLNDPILAAFAVGFLKMEGIIVISMDCLQVEFADIDPLSKNNFK